jgi:hypothetical protein
METIQAHDNVRRANSALAEFGSPLLLDAKKEEEILQLGVAPDRIDFHLHLPGAKFEREWKKRISFACFSRRRME